MKSDNKKRGGLIAFISSVATIALLSAGAVTIEAIATMVAWGLFVPSVFGLKELSFHESFGLVLLVDFVLMPFIIPINQINTTLNKYVSNQVTVNLINALRDVAVSGKEDTAP